MWQVSMALLCYIIYTGYTWLYLYVYKYEVIYNSIYYGSFVCFLFHSESVWKRCGHVARCGQLQKKRLGIAVVLCFSSGYTSKKVATPLKKALFFAVFCYFKVGVY